MRILMIACWLGLVCGLVEGIQYMAFTYMPGHIPWELRWLGVSWEILWIAPIWDLLLFLTVGAGVVFLAKLLGKDCPELFVTALLTWACFYNWLSLTGQLHETAVLALSTGLTITTYRWLRRQGLSTAKFMRRSLPYIAGIVLLLLVVTTAGEQTVKAVQTGGLPDARPHSPNVLLIVLDTLRADHLGCYGYERETTYNIDRFAREGALFERAYASSSWTVPSHASMMTGLNPSRHGANIEDPLPDEVTTLAEELARRGYETSGFVANTYWADRRSGIAQGFIHYEDYFTSLFDMIARTVYGRKIARHVLPRLGYKDILGRKRAGDVNEDFLDWVEDKTDRPFFSFLNYMDVHDPYLPPKQYRTLFSKKVDDGRFVNFLHNRFFVAKELSAEEIQMVIDAYDSSLVYLDEKIGSLFENLERLGLLENTLVIITSDHGESFGEQGIFAHSNSLYREQIHVPLIMRYPRAIPSGQRFSAPVGLTSIPSTVLGFIDADESHVFPAPSLEDLMRGAKKPEKGLTSPILSEVRRNKNAPPSWPTHSGWLKSLIYSQWHCIFHESGKVELFDMLEDPEQDFNLADSLAGKGVVEKFRSQLQGLLAGPGGIAPVP